MSAAGINPLRIAVVTGSRAEYGLLKPVMRAIQLRSELELQVVAAGSHLVLPSLTFRDVRADFEVADSVPMQMAGKTGRIEDAESVARGIARFVRAFDRLKPDWVVVLGDRIEAFAAASAASIGGFALAHIHGGDRAEGITDEAMRHAITKLAHLHFAATAQSRDRVVKMGEDPARVHCVGSPAIDGLAAIPSLDAETFRKLGDPTAAFLMHPAHGEDELDFKSTMVALRALKDDAVLAFEPNLDPGRAGVVAAIAESGVRREMHLSRPAFIGVLKRLSETTGPRRGILVGNSSAGLIEAAAIGLPVVDIGPRQSGRERPAHVVHLEESEVSSSAIAVARERQPSAVMHPYGDGHAGERIADLLSRTNPRAPGFTRKRCAY